MFPPRLPAGGKWGEAPKANYVIAVVLQGTQNFDLLSPPAGGKWGELGGTL